VDKVQKLFPKYNYSFILRIAPATYLKSTDEKRKKAIEVIKNESNINGSIEFENTTSKSKAKLPSKEALKDFISNAEKMLKKPAKEQAPVPPPYKDIVKEAQAKKKISNFKRNVNKDKNLKPLPKEFYPDENNLKDMEKYKKILDEKLKNKKMNKSEYNSIINEVKAQIKKLKKKAPAKKKKDITKDIKKDLEDVLNKYYGDLYNNRNDIDAIYKIEDAFEDIIFELKEKYDIKNFNNDTEFLKSLGGDNVKNVYARDRYIKSIKLDKLDYKKLSNYKKLINSNTDFNYIGKPPAKKAPVKKLTSKKKTDEEYQDELDKAIKIFRDKVENHKNILDIDYQTSIKFRKFNAYKNLLNTSVTGTIPERIEKYKKKLDYVDEVVKKNKIKVEKFREDLRKVTNDWYGELVKIEKKVLDGSLIDESDEYEAEYADANEDYDEALIKVNKKNNFEYNNEESYFYESRGYGRKNPTAESIKQDVIFYGSLKNYKLFEEIGEEEDGEPVEIKRKTDKSNKLDIVTKQDILDLNKSKDIKNRDKLFEKLEKNRDILDIDKKLVDGSNYNYYEVIKKNANPDNYEMYLKDIDVIKKESELDKKESKRLEKLKPNAWKLHLQKFRKENPNITGKDVMKEAKKTYKKPSSKSSSKPSKKKEIIKKDDLSKLPPPPDKFFDEDYIELLKKEEKKLEKKK